MPYSCYRRSLYITEDWSCVLAFLRCCAEYRGEELGVVTRPPTTTPPTTTPPSTTTPLHTSINRLFHMDYEALVYEEEPIQILFALAGSLGSNVVATRQDSYDEIIREEEEEVEEFEEDDLANLEDIYVRSKFFESWLWTDIRLPSVTKSDG